MPTEDLTFDGRGVEFTPMVSMADIKKQRETEKVESSYDLSTLEGRQHLVKYLPSPWGLREYDPRAVDALKSDGEKITRTLLQDLREEHAKEFELDSDFDEWGSVGAIIVAAESANVEDILSYVMEVNDYNHQIMAPLERIATSSHVDAISSTLRDMMERRKHNESTFDLVPLVRALYAIGHREPAVAGRCEELISSLAVEMNQKSPNPRYSGLTPDTLRKLKLDTSPGLIEQRYAAIFEDVDVDGFDGDIEKVLEDNPSYNPGTSERLDALRKLHSIKSTDAEYLTAGEGIYERRIERLAQLEEMASPYAPSIGLEIEVFYKSIMPEESFSWSEAEREAYMVEKMQKYLKTNEAGIPHGGDAAWEFALAPASSYRTLSREVSELIALDLINADYAKSPLHITVGGITTEGPRGREAFVLARTLEATGWKTSSGRIKKPLLTKNPGWLQKGREGVLERVTEDGENIGIELRTLQLQSLMGLDRTLGAAYYLGAALKAYQGEDSTPIGRELSAIWGEFSHRVGVIFAEYGLPNPANEPWRADYDRSRPMDQRRVLGEEFSDLAALLEFKEVDGSKGQVFVESVQSEIIDVRGRIKALLEKSISA